MGCVCIFAVSSNEGDTKTTTMKAQTQISEKCQSVLDVIVHHNQNYDPCYVSDIVRYVNMSMSEVKGYITDLRNKKLIAPHDPGCGELHAMDID
jgi:hypothetical protein